MTITTNREFAACERSDRWLRLVLGSTLDWAVLRLVLILFVVCAGGASLINFPR